MFRKICLLLLVSLVATSVNLHASEPNIIPEPSKVEVHEGVSFTINSKTTINHSEGLAELAALVQSYIYSPTAMELPLSSSDKIAKESINLLLDPAITNSEGYTLDVTDKAVTIKAQTPAGAFYGVQTLLQLLPPQIESDKLQKFSLTVPGVSIQDEPLYAWRGVMFDVGRYFFSKDFMLRFIDMMAMYKMNILHFHLIDDSGWRIEIKKYPRLTEVGAFNGEGENRSGGFYTQEDLKEMVAYGQLRGVEIVPEVAFPAHMLSAVVSYPWLSCRNEQLKMPEQHYISKDLLCVGQERSIEFLRDVIAEVVAIFPSKYLHIGGDEAVYTYWEECPHCQKVMKEQGLSKASELQGHLTNIVVDIAAEHGRTVVGWDEILERGKIEEEVVSMIWRNMSHVKNVIELDQKAVLTPVQFTYLDMPENRLPGQIKAAGWSNPVSVEKCYEFDTKEFEGNKNIVGVQASMWTDQFIHGTILQELRLLDENRSERYVEYLMLPRLLAMAEVAWTPSSQRDFKDFYARMIGQLPRLDYAGYTYALPVPDLKSKKVDGGYQITLSTPVQGAKIHYTTNGMAPTAYDPVYTKPVTVAQLSDLRAIAAIGKTHVGVATYYQEDYSAYNSYGTFAKKISHTALVKGAQNEVAVDFTGKISGNGSYEVTFIPITDGVSVELETLEMFKRGDSFATEAIGKTLATEPVVVKIDVSDWQAGTPYTGKVTLKVNANHQGNVAVFIRKLAQ